MPDRPIVKSTGPNVAPPSPPTERVMLRLEDMDQYGSPDVEAMPLKQRVMLGLAVLAAILVGVGFGMRPYLLRHRLMSALDRQLTAGDVTAAQTTLDRFVAAYPEHPDLRRYQGMVALGQADWVSAEEHLKAQVARYPDDHEASMALAYLFGLDQIFRNVDREEIDLRKAMIRDWTKLFSLTVAGMDATLESLPLTTAESGLEAQKILSRAKAGMEEAQGSLPGALAALNLVMATKPEDQVYAFEQLSSMENVSIPSFQAFYSLATTPEPTLANAGQPSPPPLNVPNMSEEIPDLPPPGAIEELPSAPSDGATPPISMPFRGGGNLSPGASFEGTLPEGGTTAAGEVANELQYPSGMGPAPRVRPYNVGSYLRVRGDEEETVLYAEVLNIRKAGNSKAKVGETIEMPNTGIKVTVRSISEDERRVVLVEEGRAVYVFIKPSGAKWQWDAMDAEDDGGDLRNSN